jgi:D-alanyl-D-alanine carboxypeptidase
MPWQLNPASTPQGKFRGGATVLRRRHAGQARQADRSVLALELSTRQAIERFCMGELAFAPGSRFDYATINPPLRRTDVRPSYMEATGGYYSTADDLLRAAYAIFNQGFISPASLQALTHIEVASDSYALGGRVKDLLIDGKRHRFAWETGRTTGYRSVLGHRLDGEETVIILNNTDMSQKTMDEFAYSLLGATSGDLPA